MKNIVLSLLIIIIAIGACENDETLIPDFVIGRNDYTTLIDGDKREYIVHVPTGYDENNPTPVVFMLHGGGGNGENPYNNSGWKEMGDMDNIITVFPTSWNYCRIDHTGFEDEITKWNGFTGAMNLCVGETPRNDVKFLSQVITELHQRLNVDSKRIYMVGFSSGARMALRCAVEISDLLAAIVQSSGTHTIDTVFTPIRNIPITLELGNRDNVWFNNGIFPPLSSFDSLLTYIPIFKSVIEIHSRSFDYESAYKLTGDPSFVLTATFESIPPEENREFYFSLINGLDHSYPNTVNHSIYGAERHWDWMKQYTLP